MRFPRIAAVITVSLLAAACADAPAEPSGPGTGDGDRVDHASGPGDLLLQMSFEGGFVPLEWNFQALPTFSLYGDGTVIVPGAQIAIYPGPALPAIGVRVVDERATQALLRRALDAGLGERDRDLSDTGDVAIADASTTVFTLTVGGRTTTTRVYALGLDDGSVVAGLPADQAELRRALSDLSTTLSDLSWLPEGSVGEEDLYEGTAARILVGPERQDEELPQRPVSWPLDRPLASMDAAPAWGPDATCAVVEGADWQLVRDLAVGANQLTPWKSGTSRYSLVIRPLLPHEHGC